MRLVSCFFACALLNYFHTLPLFADESELEEVSVLEAPYDESVLIAPTPGRGNLQEPILEHQSNFPPQIAPSNEPLSISPTAPAAVVPPSIPGAVVVPVPAVTAIKVCTLCRTAPCCCKSKRPVAAKFSLVDLRGCKRDVCLNVPECCTSGAAKVDWKGRALGRQVAKISWDCCDTESTVVVKRNGKVRVRD
jgi:hypothetical protein